MKKVWPWIIGIAFSLIIVTLIVYGRSNQQDYWVPRRATNPRVVIVVAPSEQVLEWRLHHYTVR